MTSRLNKTQNIWTLALQMLGRRAYSEYEMRQKLSNKEYAVDQIDDVISRLLSYGYINDPKLAAMLFKKHLQAGKYSLNNIICKLKQRGLPDDIIKNLANCYDYDEEVSSAVKIVRSRFKSLNSVEKEKIYRFLGTRGFGAATISKVYQQLNDNEIE